MSRFIDKRLCKKIFNLTNVNDVDLSKYQHYVYGVMVGSGYECKCYVRDFVPFQNCFNPNWKKLYDRFIQQNQKEWPVFGEKENIVIFISDKDTIEAEKEELLENWSK